MAEHCPLPFRGALVVQLLFSRAIDVSPTLPRDPQLIARLGQIRSELKNLAILYTTTGDLDRLDDLLEECSRRIKKYNEELDPSGMKPLLDRLKNFIRDASNISCDVCAGSSERICRPTTEYREVVDQGHCLSLVREIYTLVENHVRKKYIAICESADHQPEIRLSVGYRQESPRGTLVEEFHIEGETSLNRRRESADVTITLKLHDCGWNALLLLPYVIAHELTCHAFQSCAPGSGPRENAGKCCPWSEGWMDALAGDEVNAMLTGLSPVLPSWLRLSLAQVTTKTAAYRNARCSARPDVTEKVAESRRFGADGYDSLRQAFAMKQGLGKAEAAKACVDGVSLRLNAERMNRTERERLVSDLRTHFEIFDFANMNDDAPLPPAVLALLHMCQKFASREISAHQFLVSVRPKAMVNDLNTKRN